MRASSASGASPALGTESTLQTVAVHAFGRRPFVRLHGGDIARKKVFQSTLSFAQPVFFPDNLHRLLQVPQFTDGTISPERFHHSEGIGSHLHFVIRFAT